MAATVRAQLVAMLVRLTQKPLYELKASSKGAPRCCSARLNIHSSKSNRAKDLDVVL
jgi:hypothetical protein